MKQGWEMVKLKDVLKQYRITVWVDDTKLYNQLTNSKHSGIKARGNKIGGEIGRKRQFRVDLIQYPNTILYTRQTIQEDEAIGLCPPEVGGCIVTENMPLFSVEGADPHFVELYFKSKIFLKQLHLTAAIGTSQQSILEDTFLGYEIPLPPLSEQQRIAGRLTALKERIDAVRRLREEQEKEMKGVLLMQYQKVVKGAKWIPLKEAAPLIRRDVQISEDISYPEIGIRSFGKGTFHKPALNGLEVGTKRLFQIKSGDLMFSNVFAWEGAIAVAQKEDDGRFGSHRFISCVCKEDVALPEFLCFHFLTRKGLEDINLASPGGAGRNKTLGLAKLEKTLVPVPDIHLQKNFLQLQVQMETLKSAQFTQLKALEAIFPAVLEKAFRGEW